MPSAVVEAAFRARYLEEMANDPPLISAIVSAQPSNDLDAYVVIQYPVVNGSKPTIGRHYFEDGAARIVLEARRTGEMEDVLSTADEIASIFRDRKFHGIETFTPDPPTVNDASNDGNWFSLSVIIPYRYQFDD